MNRPALARLLCFAVTVNGGSALLAQAPSSSLERARQGAGFSLPPSAAPASPPHSPMPAPPVAAPQVRPVPPPVVPAGAKPPIAQTQPPVKLQAQASMPSAGTIRANSLAIPQWLKEMLDKMARENAAAAQARNRLFETGAGTVASVGAASAAEKTARRLGTDTLGAAKLLEPGIVMVNRRTKEFLVTPGGYLTIDGRGFGDTLGQVNVIGRFPGGKAALQVVDWRDTQIYALLPVGLRGAPDQVATLQVVTRQARTYRRDRANFVAAREVITFTNGIDRLVQAKAKNMDSDGSVSYRATGVNCPDLETVEDFRFTLPAGWMPSVIGLEPGRSDTGDGDADGKPGRREFFGQYAIGNWDGGNRFQISSGVWRSRNLAAARSARFAGDTCVRSYRLSVAVMGPAGLSPF